MNIRNDTTWKIPESFVDFATQEEAERISRGAHQSGIVFFIPVDEGPTDTDIDKYEVICVKKEIGGEKEK